MAHNIQQKKHYLAAPNSDCPPAANFKRGWIKEFRARLTATENKFKARNGTKPATKPS